MQGFKGLIPKQIMNDEAFQPIFRKAEEQRKATQLCIDFFQLITKFFQSYSNTFSKFIKDSQLDNCNIKYYEICCLLFENICKETLSLSSNAKSSFKQLTTLCNAIFHDYSKVVMAFQQSVRKYQQHEQIINQLCKKYYRSHKTMLGSIEAYKSSFSDVNLIYNMNEKLRRYAACEKNYRGIEEEYKIILQKTEVLTQKKINIIDLYCKLPDQFAKVYKVIGSKIIGETKNFVGYFCNSYKMIITHLAQQRFALDQEKITTVYKSIADPSKPDSFTQQNLSSNGNIPLFLEYHALIKEEYLEHYNLELLQYLKQVDKKIEKRKVVIKKMSDFFILYMRLVEKSYLTGMKDILIYFQKMKKRLGEVFGNRLVSFLKSVNSFFELSVGINQKLVKITSGKLQAIQSLLAEDLKLQKFFGDELKSNIQRFIGKKQLKKLKEDEFTEQENVVNVKIYRKEIAQKAQFIKHLIQGFNEKMERNCDKVKNTYGEIINEINTTVNEFFSFCLEYQQLYFGVDQFQSNFQKYEADIDSVMEKDKIFFQELPFNSLKNQKTKIIFDGDFSKVEDFKKIKKPVKPSQENSDQAHSLSPPTDQKQEEMRKSQSMDSQFNDKISKAGGNGVEGGSKKNVLPPNRQTMIQDEKQLKNLDFLMEKVNFKENEQLVKSFACALAEKIVLQGRIYITTERICFHSSFNSSNLFFGGTFIQIPKEHIKKIQKKINTLLIDNSISFTTINGEVFFTSFFSRNQAYDLICKTFRFNFDDEIYEFEEKQPELPQFLEELEEADDAKEEQLENRVQKIDQLASNHTFTEAAKLQFSKEGFSALKLFKLFYSDSQILVNKRTYPNFLIYMKGLINHKDLDIDPWQPPLDQILNQSNLKSGAPIKTTRKIRATIPVSANGIPFMPKTAKSEQTQTLFFYSKNKWVLNGEVSTSGAPYTDTFNVQLRTTAQSNPIGHCKLTIDFYVNFIKNTMMKSVIESKSHEETVAASRQWMEQIQLYFLNLQKSKKKHTGNPLEEIRQQLDVKTKQLEEMQKNNQKLQLKLSELNAQKQLRDKVVIIQSVLLLLLLLLVFT